MDEHVKFATVLHGITLESIGDGGSMEAIPGQVLYECGCRYSVEERGMDLCRFHEGMENGVRRALGDDGR
jgi:hypothetical protein